MVIVPIFSINLSATVPVNAEKVTTGVVLRSVIIPLILSVRVLDLTGKVVSDQDNSEFSKNSLIQIPAPGAKGIYMVEVKTGVLRYVGKVVIK